MKNIVFVIESLHIGGAEKSLVTLLQNIDFQKYNVDLIIFNKGGVFENSIPKEVTIVYKSICKLTFMERLQFKISKQLNFSNYHSAQLLWKITQSKYKLETKSYDVAIAYNQGFVTYYVERYLESNLKYTWLNTDYQKAGYNIYFDYPIYKNYNSIVAVSPEAKRGIIAELIKIDAVLKIEIIKDISDRAFIIQKSKELKTVNFDYKKINILTTGRLAKYKGLDLAVESCKILINKGYAIHWYVVGEGSERNHLEKLVSINKLQAHFTLLGMKDNPYPYMKDCTIYVQTYLFEGLGLTVIEASYLNKPIVSTNFPTVYSILKDGETGLIAEMNPKSISDKIELLINDVALKNTLITNLTNLTNMDKENTLRQFDDLMNEHTNLIF
jgi:glycosyltransferase involved in cell wall biosynthesis